jgi:hypothetical protein
MTVSTNPLQDVCDQLAAVIAAVEGIRQAAGDPPNKIDVFPFVDVYVASGAWDPARPNGMLTSVCTVNMDLHLAIKDAPRSAVLMHRLNYWIANALFKAFKAGSLPAVTSLNSLPFQLSVFPGGAGQGTDTVGYRFTAQVKVQGTIV